MTKAWDSSKWEINPSDLVDYKGFDRAFTRLLGNPDIKTHQQAFDILNSTYECEFGKARYSGLKSYRVSRSKRLRK